MAFSVDHHVRGSPFDAEELLRIDVRLIERADMSRMVLLEELANLFRRVGDVDGDDLETLVFVFAVELD